MSLSEFLIGHIDEVWSEPIELTYSEFSVPDHLSLDALIAGQSVNVNYEATIISETNGTEISCIIQLA